jgi:hypothetical protein
MTHYQEISGYISAGTADRLPLDGADVALSQQERWASLKGASQEYGARVSSTEE